MIMKCLVILATCLIASGSAFLFGGPDWDGLKVTWGLGINPFDSYTFASLPRTRAAAESAGWRPLPADGDAPYFCGARYIAYDSELGTDDPAVMLLFDDNGFIAGIQAGIPDNIANGYPSDIIKPPMIAEPGRGWYTITAYFVDPDIVCGSGRSQEDYDTQGTGTVLSILNSATGDPREVMAIPSTEDEQEGTMWSRGRCFITMGRHYWYNIREDMDCDEFRPVFLLYNSGRVNGFGWAFQADLASPRYEHPTADVVDKFIDPVPQCIINLPPGDTLSTLHVYLDDSPRTNFC